MLKKYAIIILLFSILFPASVGAASEPIEEIRGYIRDYYIEDVPAEVLAKPTAKEITSYLDPYSVYMSFAEYQQFINAIDQELIGIGVVLEENAKGVKILSVLPNSPAERAGVLPGDIITKVDGKSVAGISIQTAITFISGDENTAVFLSIFREKTNESLEKSILREKIEIPNVEYEMLGGEIGYVRLNSFSQDSAEEILPAIQALKGAKGWIFDLRDNGGGYISAAQEVAGFFPNVKKAFQLRDKSNAIEVYDVIDQPNKFTSPTHLLINGHSASASEMVSATVKEQKGAILYGQNTYGKGVMQSLIQLSDNSVLKLTTAKFFSPKGTAINKVGVAPDVKTAEGEELIASHRDQLINALKGYKELSSLKNVPVTKTFTVKMSTPMNWTGLKASDVGLIQLGGKEVEVDLKVVDDKTIKIIPKQKLESKGQYLLAIHPNWTGKRKGKMLNGTYLEVSVE
ncbi:S41 family peptidase [Bacillus sp. CGMCC 1.16607]|uniref:S41 family peptidase n=1 Tax=Bacillus sp. CGMCC 1.16607 TaxID=3351842 RepID=UPI00362AF8BF